VTIRAASDETVRIEGAASALTLSPQPVGALGVVYQASQPGLITGPGGAVTISATGAEVPSFSTPLPAVPAIRFSVPGASSGAVSFARGADLPIEWDSAQGTVAVLVSTASETLVGKFAAAAGAGVVAGALLGRFAGTQLSGNVMGWAETSVTAGDWPVSLSAASMAVDRTTASPAGFAVLLR